MMVNYFVHQTTVTKNLVLLMRKKGFSRFSLSRLIDVPRNYVEELLSVWNGTQEEYNNIIGKICIRFNLSTDYFLNKTTEIKNYETKMDPLIEELKNGLDNILDIYSLYQQG